MRKKLLTVALAATMAIGSVFSVMAEDIYTKEYTHTTNAAYEEVTNPLKGKNLDKVVIEYTCTTTEGAAANGWDGLFAFYNADTKGRIAFCTRPYLCWNDMDGGAGYIDINHPDKGGDFALQAGQKQTVVWTITADNVTCTVDGEAINLGTLGTSDPAPTYQDLLDAFNTYPTLTIGVGQAKSSFWWTELATGVIKISDGVETGGSTGSAGTGSEGTGSAGTGSTGTGSTGTGSTNGKAPQTGDAASVAVFAAIALAACVAVVATKKNRVTE